MLLTKATLVIAVVEKDIIIGFPFKAIERHATSFKSHLLRRVKLLKDSKNKGFSERCFKEPSRMSSWHFYEEVKIPNIVVIKIL